MVMMMLTMFSALYYLEETIDKHREELMDESTWSSSFAETTDNQKITREGPSPFLLPFDGF